MNQLSLFACESSELESKALLLVTLDSELLDLEGERKLLAEKLKECSEAQELKDVRDQIKEAKDRRALASKELYALKRKGV